MLNPNQINSHKFHQSKQGFYKADEVDEYMKLVYQTVVELYETNKQIQRRIAGLTGDLEAYYKDRNLIAAAIISAQSYASEKAEEADASAKQIISQAHEQAQQILDSKKHEADEYYTSKKQQADEALEKAENALEAALNNANEKAQEYISGINLKASEIITKANEQASKIVSRAFSDAKKARETCDEIIESANLALPSVGQNIYLMKTHLEETFETIMNAVNSINVPEEISIEKTAIDEQNFDFQPEPFPEPLNYEEKNVESDEEFVETEKEAYDDSDEKTSDESEEKSDNYITDLFGGKDDSSIDDLIGNRFDIEEIFNTTSQDSEE